MNYWRYSKWNEIADKRLLSFHFDVLEAQKETLINQLLFQSEVNEFERYLKELEKDYGLLEN